MYNTFPCMICLLYSYIYNYVKWEFIQFVFFTFSNNFLCIPACDISNDVTTTDVCRYLLKNLCT